MSAGPVATDAARAESAPTPPAGGRERAHPLARTLPAPDPCLRASIVVPARDEEERIEACLEALAAQVDVDPCAFEVLLVLDACTDATGERAARVASGRHGLRLYLIEGPGGGSGPARALGMDTACARLHAAGRPGGLVASTDADSVVAADWLAAQLAAAERGARAIGGRIELCPVEREALPAGVADLHAARGHERHRRLLGGGGDGESRLAEHWQFSGASMAVTAATYRAVGGLGESRDLEDESLERALVRHGVVIERSLSVRVRTSARTDGRATRGLARDLAEAGAAVKALDRREGS